MWEQGTNVICRATNPKNQTRQTAYVCHRRKQFRCDHGLGTTNFLLLAGNGLTLPPRFLHTLPQQNNNAIKKSICCFVCCCFAPHISQRKLCPHNNLPLLMYLQLCMHIELSCKNMSSLAGCNARHGTCGSSYFL